MVAQRMAEASLVDAAGSDGVRGASGVFAVRGDLDAGGRRWRFVATHDEDALASLRALLRLRYLAPLLMLIVIGEVGFALYAGLALALWIALAAAGR